MVFLVAEQVEYNIKVIILYSKFHVFLKFYLVSDN